MKYDLNKLKGDIEKKLPCTISAIKNDGYEYHNILITSVKIKNNSLLGILDDGKEYFLYGNPTKYKKLKELKTLNGIYWKKNEHPKDILKQEAIKQIRAWQCKDGFFHDNLLSELNNNLMHCESCMRQQSIDGIIEWIKYSYNVTEEDLKC